MVVMDLTPKYIILLKLNELMPAANFSKPASITKYDETEKEDI